MSVADRIRTFIVDEFGSRSDLSDLGVDSPLVEAEVIDSMGIFHLISFLEGAFGIEIYDDDLVPDNFATISDIEQLVIRRSG